MKICLLQQKVEIEEYYDVVDHLCAFFYVLSCAFELYIKIKCAQNDGYFPQNYKTNGEKLPLARATIGSNSVIHMH